MKSITQALSHPKPSRLEEVRQSFEHWRSTRKKFGPIPRELWKAAVELTESYPVTKVCQVLRLSNPDLRKRINGVTSRTNEKKSKAICRGKPTGLSFVDIFAGGNVQERETVPDCALEISDRSGFSLKMQCRGETSADFLSICRVVIERLL